MEYLVIGANNLKAVVELVNEKLADGWKLQGGIAISSSTDQGYTRDFFAQAMIKTGE